MNYKLVSNQIQRKPINGPAVRLYPGCTLESMKDLDDDQTANKELLNLMSSWDIG